jgi:hypothetical protein
MGIVFKTQRFIPLINNPNIFYIYKDGKLVDGSSFFSYSLAHKALVLNSKSSNTCDRFIDAGKLYPIKSECS